MEQTIQNLTDQFTIFNSVNHPLFYEKFIELLSKNDEETIKYLSNKSPTFKYLEFLKEKNLLKTFKYDHLKISNAKKWTIKVLIVNNLNCEKTITDIMNKGIHPCHEILTHMIPTNIVTKYRESYLYFAYSKYIIFAGDMRNACLLMNLAKSLCDIDEKVMQNVIKYLNSIPKDELMKMTYFITPNMYDHLIQLNPKINEYKYSTNDSNFLLFCAEQNNLKLFKHLIDKYHFDIDYKNKLGYDYKYYVYDIDFIEDYNQMVNNEKLKEQNEQLQIELEEKTNKLNEQNEQLQIELEEKTNKLNKLNELMKSFDQ